MRIRRGPWRRMQVMPTIMEVKEVGTKEEDVTSKVRLNLTPFMLHTLILFETLSLQFYVHLVSVKVNKRKEVND